MNDVANASFRPALPWVNGTLQTVASRLRPQSYDLGSVSRETQRIVPMEDGSGDALAVRVHRPVVGQRRDRPVVVVVHGLGGSIESSYVRAAALGLLRAGYPVARVDLRGIGDSSPHCTALYHGGRSEDLRSVLRAAAQEPDATGVAVMGFSLGGNVTLKLLGEPLDGLPVLAGVSVSAPLDLSSDAEHLSRRWFGIYERFLLSKLRADIAASGVVLTGAERSSLAELSTIAEFDSLITARHNGWRDAAEYYAVNSSAQFLPSITVPTLVIHAMDDPMIPAAAYRAIDWASLARTTPVRRRITPTGGHVGFHERDNPLPWFVAQAVSFFEAV